MAVFVAAAGVQQHNGPMLMAGAFAVSGSLVQTTAHTILDKKLKGTRTATEDDEENHRMQTSTVSSTDEAGRNADSLEAFFADDSEEFVRKQLGSSKKDAENAGVQTSLLKTVDPEKNGATMLHMMV
eukprot:CAMPEP_0178989586 /NCGR_PEP_ID=MMETSP0795-20121207/4460_1 /TAXON_ID=88552 /ORGANISM="Amoebophrya sp., Strain Ameob2" /LENGTH=126 /DNA_ID=CAMNT_0020681011 /DNA_START=181 /DNA_END=561 /DNA_ORIENTATION=+